MQAMLLALGCCFNAHNVFPAHNIGWTWPYLSGNKCAQNLWGCEQALIKELQYFQCVADNPWVEHWRALTAAYPSAVVVLTRAISPVHHALSVKHFWRDKGRPFGPSEVNRSVGQYKQHLAEVREKFHKSDRYFEICLPCGDDVWTLARSLRLDVAHLQLPPAASAVHNSHAHRPQEDLAFLREYAPLDR